jgi:beta-glucosidase
MSPLKRALAVLALLLGSVTPLLAAEAAHPWLDAGLAPARRAALALQAMTEEEKLDLVFSYFGSVSAGRDPPAGARMGSAGYVPGIPRLGIPPQWITDAGLGVATQRDSADAYRERTALPSGLATAASWNPALAGRGGAMIGREAHASGFNVILGPGLDLVREPRGGRDFEYAGEDPLLAGTMAAAEIRGIQSQHVIAVAKHFALNDQETGRTVLSADIGEAAARESDLLAFELAIEHGHPGAVMCSYNRINGVYACEDKWLLRDVLDDDWGFSGYVMSDWGAVHSTAESALAGLDQQSAYTFDSAPFYRVPLKTALDRGQIPMRRLDDMAVRILRAMFAVGAVDHPIRADAQLDLAADQQVAQADEEQGIVLLKNSAAILPLAPTALRLLVVGGHADRGVISGGGSSTVFPVGVNAVPGVGPKDWPGPVVYLPSPPLAAIMEQAPQAQVRYLAGDDIAQAVAAARSAERVVVFATQWETESEDVALELDGDQNQLIAAVAAANPHTVVVLETGGPVLMPWLGKVAGVLEAWYPGSGGGEAIARVLFGAVNPSGHLPVSFPASVDELPHPLLPGTGVKDGQRFALHYGSGAAVGYKWYQAKGLEPLFDFGFGLSYTRFDYRGLAARPAPDGTVLVSFSVRNAGPRAGAAVAEVYAGPAGGGWEAPRRLAAFGKVELAAGASRHVSLKIDPRLLAVFDAGTQRWRRKAGTYELWLGSSSADLPVSITVRLSAWQHSARWSAGGVAPSSAPGARHAALAAGRLSSPWR